jgi:hypothetical protein
MADYKGIKGFKVQYLSADPSNPIIGQTWYNDTSKALKYTGATATGTWASGNNVNTARQSLAGTGSQTAALIFGGSQGTPSPMTETEEYDGTNWTSVNSMSTGRFYLMGSNQGTQTASWAAGGFATPGTVTITNTEEYDGTNWTAGGSLPSGLANAISAGTLTAGLIAGGPGGITTTLHYDGSSWTTVPATISPAIAEAGGGGIQTSAILCGGSVPGTPGDQNLTQEYNGTIWTVGPNMNVVKQYYKIAAANNDSVVAFAGAATPSPLSAATEEYNGTSWTTSANSPFEGQRSSGAGTQAAAFMATGQAPPGADTAASAEYIGSGVIETKTITVS